MQRSNRYEAYQTGFSLKAWVQSPGLDLEVGPRPKLNLFLIWSCQIKANDACSNMIANILPTCTPPTPGMGSKGQDSTFWEHSHVAYPIKGKLSIEHYESKYSVLTHTLDPWGEVKRSIFLFWNWSCCIPKLKLKMQANTLILHIPLTSGVGLKGQILKLCR